MQYRDAQGNPQRPTVYRRSRTDAARALATLVSSIDFDSELRFAPGEPLSTGLTVGEVLEQWLEEEVRPRRRVTTYEAYRRNVRNHLDPGLGALTVTELSPALVEGFLNSRLVSGLAPKTVDFLHATLRAALSRAERFGLVPQNVARLVPATGSGDEHVSPLTPDQARTLLDGLEAHWLGPLCTVALSLGLRAGELRGLRWDDVELKAGLLHVRQTIQRVSSGLVVLPPKTEQGRRSIPLPPMAITALRQQAVLQANWRSNAGDRWEEQGLVFTTSVGTPLDPANVARSLNRKLDRLALPRFGLHRLRHTCASYLVSAGVDLRIIMDILGHADIRTTVHYASVLPAASVSAMANIAAVLRPPVEEIRRAA